MRPLRPRTISRLVAIAAAVAAFTHVLTACAVTADARAVSSPIDGAPFLAWNDPRDELRDWPTALADYGYVEEEFFIAGHATAYEPVGPWEHNGRWNARPATKARFVTRLLIRRPTNALTFNGIAVVEWLNTSFGHDLDSMFRHNQRELLQDGYAWVGVSAHANGVDALKRQDPVRYRSLRHPGDAYSFGMVTRAARTVADPKTRVLGGLQPDAMLATGVSQSAGWLVTYINALHPLVNVFDGFLLRSAIGAMPLVPSGTMPVQPKLRTDARAPVISVQTETDLIAFKAHLRRQRDNRNFRLWEVAGTSHLDSGPLHPDGVPASFCTSSRNTAPLYALSNAALAALARWVRADDAPPHATRLELTAATAADPLRRDQFGNAQGGVRLPELEVPRATLDGLPSRPAQDAPPSSGATCLTQGRTIPFPDSLLAELYPKDTDYTNAFIHAVRRAVRAGFLLQADGQRLIQAEGRPTSHPVGP
jgi:hypothetical protein